MLIRGSGRLAQALGAMSVRPTLLYLPALLASFLSQAVEPPQIEDASIIQLIANPERYEGKLVNVIGFVELEFEGNAIYLHREDFEQGLPSNGLWLNIGKCDSAGGKNFTRGYAIVVGRFTGKRHGHMGLWSGQLDEVQRCQAWHQH